MANLKGKRVLVLGLGVHGGGLGVTRWLLNQGAIVTVTDLKSADELEPSLSVLHDQPVRFVLGEHRAEDILNSDLIVRSPGVPRESRWLELARKHAVPVEMEMGLFLQEIPRGSAQVIGITGTKGKTTTTLMVGAILKKVNENTVVAGNLRISALELLPVIKSETSVVLELSSWQLEGLEPHKISPHIAGITNISPDHLNRYRDMEDYADSKTAIFRYQQPGDYVVLYFDNQILSRLAPRASSQVVWASTTRPLSQGAYRDGGALYWAWEGDRAKIIDVKSMRVAGAHNVENALMAIALASVWGAKTEQIASALAEFAGTEHRQEFVRELDGVRYVNDTTATAPAAGVAAINALVPTAANVILIAGGADKGLDFSEMAQSIVSSIRQVILLEGTATSKLEKAIGDAGGRDLVSGRYSTMKAAVEQARKHAHPGDIVLLSPGCASFGMFANEFDRGNTFKKIVSELEPLEYTPSRGDHP